MGVSTEREREREREIERERERGRETERCDFTGNRIPMSCLIESSKEENHIKNSRIENIMRNMKTCQLYNEKTRAHNETDKHKKKPKKSNVWKNKTLFRKSPDPRINVQE